MRRLLAFAAFLLVISLVPVFAQRGGGHAGGGGGHAGFSGGHAGFGGGFSGHSFSGAGSGFSGSHFASGSHFGSSGFSHGNGFSHGTHVFIRTYPYRRGYGWGYGYPYYGYLDPYWWYDSYSSYDPDYERQRQIASQMNDENLELQERLRAQDQQNFYPRRPAPAHQEEQAASDPATVLVFRDQHKREIQNYAIVGHMLWSFGPQRTEKIPLSELDIPATERANEDRGVDFRVPHAAGEGQKIPDAGKGQQKPDAAT
jgi:hypothetical protein